MRYLTSPGILHSLVSLIFRTCVKRYNISFCHFFDDYEKSCDTQTEINYVPFDSCAAHFYAIIRMYSD